MRPNAIEQIVLRSVQDKYAPPDKSCLSFSVVGDIAFLNIVKWEETSDETSQKTEVSIDIDAEALLEALWVAVRDEYRSRTRERL